MLKLIKYLKPFIFSIIFIVGLLYLQAVCDLSLPDYMSRIVNVGIQQNGIDNSVPEVIRVSELEKISIFLDENDLKEVKNSYKLIEKDDKKYIKEYPILKNTELYKLNTKNKDEINKINNILSKPILIVYNIEKGNIPGMQIPSGMDPFVMLKNMTKEQLDTMLNKSGSKLKEMPESMITQVAIEYIKKEYKTIGININNMQSNYVIYMGALMIGVALLSMLASVIVGFISAKLSAGLGQNLRLSIFKKVESFSNIEFDKFGSSSLITRTTNDVQQIQTLMVMMLRIVFYAPILAFGGFIKVLNTDTSMSWIIGVAIAAILVVVSFMFIVVMPKFTLVQKFLDKLNLIVREGLNGMLVIRAFNTERHEEKKFDKTNKDLTKTSLFIHRVMSGMMPTMMFIMNAITILIVWVGAHQVDDGAMQVGSMMAFIQYAMQIIWSFLMIAIVSVMIPRATVSASRIGEVLDTNIAINDPKNPVHFSKDGKRSIEFKNVSFKYPGAEDYVLKDINFVAKQGETTAFIGSTGSGKSTLINLIPRFYDITEGSILIDGIDIRNVTQHELREKIGYVPQRGVLFSGTIESNLKYGNNRATEEDLKKAATISQAADFIEEMEKKYENEIAQGGTNVSGGQKQRLAIARAVVKKPEIYIFDDSFSALDFKTDAKLRRELKGVTENSITLIVAQRISTIMKANQIIVLDEGKIVGIGTHNELMNNCKEYKEIALSQLSKEELA